MGDATIRISLKTIAFLFPAGSIERIYLHGKWQIERGRNPSLTYGNHRTARTAFLQAQEMVGPYFDEIRRQHFSRQDFFWHPEMIIAIQKKSPVTELPLPAAYR